MDAITVSGLALSVVGLVPLCANGFEFLKSIVNALQAAAEACASIDCQSKTFLVWTEHWKIGLNDPQPSKTADRDESPLKEYLKSGRNTGQSIIEALVSIANTFKGAHELEKTYGIDVQKSTKDLSDLPPLETEKIISDFTRDAAKILRGEPVNMDLDYMKKRKVQMSFFRKVGYTLKGTRKIEKLAKDIDSILIP